MASAWRVAYGQALERHLTTIDILFIYFENFSSSASCDFKLKLLFYLIRSLLEMRKLIIPFTKVGIASAESVLMVFGVIGKRSEHDV